METIFEKVFVETPVDTDGDGKLDLIAVYIKRPKGLKNVPVIFVANPYLQHCNEDWYDLFDVKEDIKAYKTQNIKEEDIRFDFDKDVTVNPLFPRVTTGSVEENAVAEETDFECISSNYDHLIEKGYALVFSGGLGTRYSDGVVLTGSREEVLAFKSVVDWLCMNGRAFTNKTDNVEVIPTWSKKAVAMSGKSYLGTMCIAVATTGVDGLKTIIPEAGISNWYDYYRTNGLCVSALGWSGDDASILAKYCTSRAFDSADFDSIKEVYENSQKYLIQSQDRESGNYNKFWDERNYLNLIDKIKCSVFIIQGLNDFNVKPNQATNLFMKLQEKGIERRMLFHRGEHIYVYNHKELGISEMFDKWLDHYLKDEDNGIEKEPCVYVQSNQDQFKFDVSDIWPVNSSFITVKGEVDKEYQIIDDISKTSFKADENNCQDWLDELVMSDSDNAVRLSVELKDRKRISGNVKVKFSARINRPTAIFSAMLVERKSYRHLSTEIDGDLEKEFSFKTEENPKDYHVITRGHLNAQNRSSLIAKEEIMSDRYYEYEFELVSTDYTTEDDTVLELIIYGIDVEQTAIQKSCTNISIKANSINCLVPIY